ncbi:electron transfer flavoprotein subunit beta [Ammoniphilus sp. 3BR4]|uniref:electron transfer flavoprotein subunit beta/FixA family protein n=1 Tax=Ammoniphilus sp. 3BR4 TaxID=3158265 RepID=UPI0034675313
MNILVLLKQTFDTEEKIEIVNGEVSEEGIKFIINPYDEYAVEEAVSIKENHGGEVTVLTLGPSRAEEALRTALAMGADKAVLIEGEDLNGDEYVISKILASYIKGKNYDLIIGGYMAVDDGSAQVGPRVAEELEIPHVATIVKLNLQDSKAIVERDVEGNKEVIEVGLPALFTSQQGLNEPRFPSIPNIMKAKRKPLERLAISGLNLSEEDLKAKTEFVHRFLPSKKEAGRILQGSLQEQAKELVELLKLA